MEKCFCHIVDSTTGEIYVVKDKQARADILALAKTVGEHATTIEAAYKAADAADKAAIEAAYTAADAAIENAYKAADSALNTRCNDANNRITRIDGNIEELYTSVDTLNTRHWEQAEKISNHAAKITAIENANAAQDTKINNIETTVTVLQNTLNNFENYEDIDGLLADLNAVEARVGTVETLAADNARRLNDHVSRISTAEADLTLLKTASAAHDKHITEYQEKVEGHDQDIEQLSDDMGDYWEFKTAAKAKINQLLEYVLQLASYHETGGALVPPVTNAADWQNW